MGEELDLSGGMMSVLDPTRWPRRKGDRTYAEAHLEPLELIYVHLEALDEIFQDDTHTDLSSRIIIVRPVFGTG